MARVLALLVVLGALAATACAAAPSAPRFEGRLCKLPAGHQIVDCRVARHGTPDLSRAAFRALRGEEVSIDVPIDGLAPNPAAAGARSWQLLDSLGQQMGTIEQTPAGRVMLHALDGTAYRATSVHMRGHGCAANPDEQRRFALLQVIASKAPASGTQAFVDTAALDLTTPSGQAALAAFSGQLGGGTGCGPAGPAIGKARKLTNPRVGDAAHARLSDGTINSVNEYDAKPAFGNVVYFMSNTTAVHNGGIARGMVRVGTPVAKVDSFTYCDPSSDGTLTWRYWAIATGGSPMYGWIPARCPAQIRGRKPS